MLPFKKLISIFAIAFLVLSACNNETTDEVEVSGFDSSPEGPPPDNDAANTPALADTMTLELDKTVYDSDSANVD